MNPNEAIRRPEWHGCHEFTLAWSAIARAASVPTFTDAERENFIALAHVASCARVVRADGLQLSAVSNVVSPQDWKDWLGDDDVPLPFNPLFVVVDHTSTGGESYGFILASSGRLIALHPFFRPIQDCSQYICGVSAEFSPDREFSSALGIKSMASGCKALYLDNPSWGDAIDACATSALALIYLLASANVDLVEPTHTRQQRRAARRRNARIPLEIAVKRSRSRSVPRGGTRRYSHAFDVAGNFAHHFETTAEGTPNRLFEKWSQEKPEKVVQVGGRDCIRIWRPPYVKGEGVYVPKIRDARGLAA